MPVCQIAVFVGVTALVTHCYPWALVCTVQLFYAQLPFVLLLLIFEYWNIICSVSLEAKIVNVGTIYTLCED
jgi:hypothetical protein